MRTFLSLTLATFVSFLAGGCQSRALVGGADGGDRLDAAGSDGLGLADAIASDTLPALPPEALTCTTDGDCQASEFGRPVTSVTDCYCPTCATTALKRAVADAYRAAWAHHCTGWSGAAACPIYDCIAPPPVACVAGMCRAGQQLPPQSCPVEAFSDCASSAIRCGGVCCVRGEWCDAAIGKCRCGYGPACGPTQACGRTDRTPVAGGCGDSCCFDCPP